MNYKSVTLWHKKPDESYERILFDKVLIFEKKRQDTFGSVIDGNNHLEARIFSVSKRNIALGDMIAIGYESSLTPTDNAYIINEIRENFSTNANLRHYKITGVWCLGRW